MSQDSKLKNYNAVMILKEEKSDDLLPREKVLVHEQDLEYQQKDLFWAFVNGDTNYIYPFDTETLRKREHFLAKAFSIGFTGLITLTAANYIFMKYVKTQSIYSNAIKASLLATSNIVPITILSYQGVKLYGKVNNFLYEKYLKGQR